MTQKSWFFKHRIMPKIIHHFFSLTFFLMLCVSSAFGAGYTCPTNRKYTTCNEGYYLAYSYTGTSYDSIKHWSTPRAGNACRPCTDYDNYYNKPEGSYYCEGKTKAPVLDTVTITYNLNGGSGTTPASKSCTKGQTCTLNQGATTSFYRAGYVFKGWALTSDATSGFTSYTFTAADTVYAVWEKCGLGEYKPGSGTRASAACSSCPELTTGFEYWRADTTLPSSLSSCVQAVIDPSDVDSQCASRDPSRPAILQVAASDDAWGRMMAGVLVAKPGAYLNFQNTQVIPEGTDLDNLCTECDDGTYSEGGDITSCTACPSITATDEQVGWKISTGGTGATSWEACYTYWNRHPSTCATGGYKREAISAGGYQEGMLEDPENPFTAIPGYYVTYTGGTGVSPTCVECSAGTYSPGGDVHSCSPCPKLTPGFEYVPTTGNTSLTACKQGLKNPADINEFCEAASGTTAEELKIQCWAASDGTWGDCIRTGFPFDAKPGSYVGIPSQSQSMPVEDVVENICIQCTDGTYSEGGGATSCSECPALPTADERDGWKISTGGDGATSSQDCYAYLESYPTNCASGSFKRMLMGGGTGYYGSEWFELEPLTANPGYRVDFEDGQTDAPACVECSAGTYSPGGDVHSCSACPTGYDDNPETGLTSADMCQISCPGGYYLAAANDATCSEVSPGYWAAEKIVNYGDTSTRTECASGLTTIGYGAGADEAADCGRVLHFGNDTLYLRSVKKTDHALHVGINGTVFYGNMGTDLTKGSLRIKLGDTTYSVYDDRVYDDSM